MVGDATGALAGFAFAGAIVFAGFAFVALAGATVTGVAAGTVVVLVVVVLVVDVVFVVAVLAGLAFALLAGAASPQAMPRALNPSTVESAITFFILFKDSYLSQSINFLFPGVRLIEHSRFALNSFLFKANVNIVIAAAIVN